MDYDGPRRKHGRSQISGGPDVSLEVLEDAGKGPVLGADDATLADLQYPCPVSKHPMHWENSFLLTLIAFSCK